MTLRPAREELSKNSTDWETRSHFLPSRSTQGSCQGLGQDRGSEGKVWLPQDPSPSPGWLWGTCPAEAAVAGERQQRRAPLNTGDRWAVVTGGVGTAAA